MNKKTKITLGYLLSISCLSVFSPVGFPIITTNAYAEVSTYSLADSGELKSLDVQSTDGESLELCDNYGSHKKVLTDDEHYYVVLNGNSDGVKIFADVEGKGYVAKVFESNRKYATAHNLGENISLLKGENILYLRTYTSEEAFENHVDDEDVTNCVKTYKIYISKSPAENNDDIGLDSLTLDSGKVPINFDIDTTTYNISVNEDQEDVEIKARPSSNKYSVSIDGFTADEDTKYKKDLHLKKGLNVIKVVVTGTDYSIRTYTLNITRGNTTTAINTTQTSSNSNNIKGNQWMQVDGAWKYYDSTGNPLKNKWYYDGSYGKNYYLKDDGTMATGWLNLSGNWYYLGQDGGMKTGWQLINGNWYYLDSQGIMAKNTTIGKYKLGSNGSWIK